MPAELNNGGPKRAAHYWAEHSVRQPVPQLIACYLDTHQITAAEFAKRIGAGHTIVYNWLRGANGISKPYLKPMSDLLNVPIEQLNRRFVVGYGLGRGQDADPALAPPTDQRPRIFIHVEETDHEVVIRMDPGSFKILMRSILKEPAR